MEQSRGFPWAARLRSGQPVLPREHLVEYTQDLPQRWLRECAQPLRQAFLIDHADLVHDDVAVFSGEPTRHTEWVLVGACRERGDDERLEVRVQLVRGDNQARARLPFLTPTCRTELHEVDVAAARAE